MGVFTVRLGVAVAAVLAFLSYGYAWGQVATKSATNSASTSKVGNYPSRPIRLILTGAPGGTHDINNRLVAAEIEQHLRQNIVMDSRPGANGIIATQLVVESAPDGHTLLSGSTSIAINSAVYRKLPYDTQRDLTPVTFIGLGIGYVVVASPSFPGQSIHDLIAFAKKKSKQVPYGMAGIGNSTHLVVEMFSQAAGIQLLPVAYKGVAPTLAGVVSGEVQIAFVPPTAAIPYLKAGRLRVIAFTGKSRWSVLPDVPTIGESGVPGFYKDAGWNGWFAPSKTPPEILALLQSHVRRALSVPKVRDVLTAGGYEPLGNTPVEAREFFRSELQAYGNIVRSIGIKSE